MAACWKQRPVPLRTLFGWPLCYVTEQFRKTQCVHVCVYVGKRLERWLFLFKCSGFSWRVFYDWTVDRFQYFSYIKISSRTASLVCWKQQKKKLFFFFLMLWPSSLVFTWRLYEWRCDWRVRSLLFHRRSAPERTKYAIGVAEKPASWRLKVNLTNKKKIFEVGRQMSVCSMAADNLIFKSAFLQAKEWKTFWVRLKTWAAGLKYVQYI